MFDLYLTGTYKKDLKLLAKRGYDLNLLANVVSDLRIPKQLPPLRKYMQSHNNAKTIRNLYHLYKYPLPEFLSQLIKDKHG